MITIDNLKSKINAVEWLKDATNYLKNQDDEIDAVIIKILLQYPVGLNLLPKTLKLTDKDIVFDEDIGYRINIVITTESKYYIGYNANTNFDQDEDDKSFEDEIEINYAHCLTTLSSLFLLDTNDVTLEPY